MSTPTPTPEPEPPPPPPPPGDNNNTPPPPPPPSMEPRPRLRTRFSGITSTLRGTQHQLPSSSINNNNDSVPPPPINNNAGEVPVPPPPAPPPPTQTQNLFQMRDRLFLALFFRVSLIYARAFPSTLRRVLEFCLLMQSILLLFILGYIHVVYTNTPITCLNEYKDLWPKNGVLRVEIMSMPVNEGGELEEYDLSKSYAKEERVRQRMSASQVYSQYADDFFSLMWTADSIVLARVVSTAGGLLGTVTGDEQEVAPTKKVEKQPPEGSASGATATVSPEVEEGTKVDNDTGTDILDEGENPVGPGAAEGERRTETEDVESIAPSIPITGSGEGSVGTNTGSDRSAVDYETIDVNNPDSPFFNKTLEEIEMIKMQQKQVEEDKLLNSSVTDFEMFANSVWIQEQAYIVEYALEYGFLRLSADTRQKLNIPVKLVILDPTKQPCFGNQFSLFLLENFLGYDDLLMASIKNLAESEENKGYLRNVITGEQFRFVTMWMARSSYVPALLIMLVFTVSISMLLRYSHHQIFVFIVDLLNNMEGTGSIHIPAAPLFTVILALVGMEAIMSEFFNDTSTAFYVILIVWIADQYDSICSHTQITKMYWVRFFYLYHFAFYAYHYRFNGQYGGLALLVSWSFIQHSMVYFYHHYELPAILRQAAQSQQDQGIPPEGVLARRVRTRFTVQVPRPQEEGPNLNAEPGSGTGSTTVGGRARFTIQVPRPQPQEEEGSPPHGSYDNQNHNTSNTSPNPNVETSGVTTTLEQGLSSNGLNFGESNNLPSEQDSSSLLSTPSFGSDNTTTGTPIEGEEREDGVNSNDDCNTIQERVSSSTGTMTSTNAHSDSDTTPAQITREELLSSTYGPVEME